jgi:hypothetical protein
LRGFGANAPVWAVWLATTSSMNPGGTADTKLDGKTTAKKEQGTKLMNENFILCCELPVSPEVELSALIIFVCEKM